MAEHVHIRPCASLEDVAAIEATIPTGASAYHQQRYGRGDGSIYLLAWHGAVAIGHVLVTPDSKYPEVWEALGRFPEVNALAVAEGWRRQGIARLLMRAAEDIARTLGGRRLGLAVEPENTAALTLYRSLGFTQQVDLTPVDVWTWIDSEGFSHEQRDPCTYWVKSLTPV